MTHDHDHWPHHSIGARGGEQGFTCRACRRFVSCNPSIAGVQNRNHCPTCLASRHLDGRRAGDRRSACRATMRPIGLTTKRSRNKYARERDGELMIVHCCNGCEQIVINRIAADDNVAALLALFEESCALSAAFRADLAAQGIGLLAGGERALVRRRLVGNGALATLATLGAEGM